ncbi:hypothetical protein I6A84_31955 [Frankia sp. CNm7]|uniref:Uncharacterized protein n=1 Tax=Frankia nepalensis TaxID=1836974 RepID=A0A937RNU5_9ACTN|nr:hypothetical protein [Frankia nepalensis]MBL7499293.1 hypothetical protein [Frankia nepalensis]MBL7512359.1 hypothetical protein [Frankia nepalensis]MBL7522578.1 hypothetical protein [Frankia nepalensis]MBL7632209.1 hypothetical protein [Frankia nepalensis]
MREATNLSWTDTPFGGARRPFANRTPLLAAFSVNATGHSPAAAAVYLPLPRARSLTVTDGTVRFGFHAIAAEEPAETSAVTASIDALLVQARRQAAILAGHRLGDQLAALPAAGAGQPARGITAMRAAWHSQPAERGLARLHDTGSGPGPITLADICAGYNLALPADIPLAGPDQATSQILRQLLIYALAIALIAARNVDRYQWQALHPGAVVEAAAWDQLTDLPLRLL